MAPGISLHLTKDLEPLRHHLKIIKYFYEVESISIVRKFGKIHLFIPFLPLLCVLQSLELI